jgi:cytochrome c oxidase assembly protein subunit 15
MAVMAEPIPRGRAIRAPASLKPVRVWLYGLAALVFLMVLVGGVTRLTDSGLSITEWKPVVGMVPPLSEAAWEGEFAKYRRIPEYRVVNKGMSLDEFKRIYWWEWRHRRFGEAIALAFLVPFAAFIATGVLTRRLIPRLSLIFAAGILQGAVGWWMVASGLRDRIDVSQIRLAVHLTLACLLFAAILWTARSLAPARQGPAPFGLKAGAVAVVMVLFLQIFLGGLVAGLDAGLAYNTWPLMEGAIVPTRLLVQEPWWRNLFENAKTVQFDHRMVAYALAALVLLHALHLARASRDDRQRAVALGGALILQFALGAAALLQAVPLWLGLVHQAGALVLLAVAVWNAQALLGSAPSGAALAAPARA